jgi:two-component system sensor histidine kinase MprB
MSLRTRLTVGVTVIVAAAVIGGAYASHYSTSRQLRAATDKFLVQRAERFKRGEPGGGGGDGGHPPDGGAPPQLSGGRGPVAEFDAVTQILSTTGTIVSTTGGPPLPVDAGDRALAAKEGAVRIRDVHVGGTHYRLLTAHQGTGGAAQIARSLTEPDDLLRVLRDRLVVIALAGIAFAAVIGWALARRTITPIMQLTATAERVAATEDLSTPISVSGSDEVGRLAASFNTMLAALATSREQQQRLVSDASHELRTPLTALRTNIEFLERATALPADERAALLGEARLELTELTALVTELVELAGDTRADEPIERVDLSEIADDVAARFRRRTGRVVTVASVDAATVDGRRAMIERAIANLVDNALKFSEASAPVEISVSGTRVEVADRGPGIAVEDRERVFDRFYRATPDRTLTGSGLGLSIVSQIAAAHEARASMHDRPGGGTIARLEFANGSTTIA